MAQWVSLGSPIKSSVRLYMQESTYKLELTRERLLTYVAGLDSGIKLIAQQLLQQNSPLALRELLPKLTKINEELQYLDKLIDETDKQTAGASNA